MLADERTRTVKAQLSHDHELIYPPVQEFWDSAVGAPVSAEPASAHVGRRSPSAPSAAVRGRQATRRWIRGGAPIMIIAAPENRVTARAAAGRASRIFRAKDPRPK